MSKDFPKQIDNEVIKQSPRKSDKLYKKLKVSLQKISKIQNSNSIPKMRPAASRQKIKNMKSSNSRLQQPYGFQKTKNIQKPSQKKIKN